MQEMILTMNIDLIIRSLRKELDVEEEKIHRIGWKKKRFIGRSITNMSELFSF